MDYTAGIVPLNPVHKAPYSIAAPGYERIPGARKLVKLHRETRIINNEADPAVDIEREWQFYELTGYEYLTYKEYETLVLQIGSGLREVGLSAGDKVHIFATTSIPWLSMSHGCASQSIPIVTAYDSLGENGVKHSLVQTNARAMFVDPHLLKMATKPIRESGVKIIIVNNQCLFTVGGEIEEFKKNNPDLTVLTFDELRMLGEENMVEAVPADPTDIYCIMYTSGSTGAPKGVCITHEALVASLTGLLNCVNECVSDKDYVLAFLPLAHIFEMVLENLVLFIGGTLGYSSPRTLSDVSVKNCRGDMREFRPTVLIGVPQVWENVRKAFMLKLENEHPVQRFLFWAAFSYKSFMSRNKLPLASIFDGIILSKVRESTGGRVRFIVNAASGIATSTQRFLSLVLAPMLLGYGLTETCGCGALGSPLEFSLYSIGTIPASIDVKLVSVPDLGYNADGVKAPQGEILLKGLPVMTAYFNNPEETARALTSDSWFKSGDIGEFDVNGLLRVIDRIKNLVKMQGGEYIALEKVESIYLSAKTVANVMIYADADHLRPIAIIMPSEKVLVAKAKELGIVEKDLHTNPKIRDFVFQDLQATGRRSGLSKLEIVSGLVITDGKWTPESGLVTATQKLNRKTIQERFKKEIHECLQCSF